MDKVTRVLAAVSLAVVAGAGLTACASEDDAPEGGAGTPTVSATMTTTTSSPIPGPEGSTVEIPAVVAERWNELGGLEGDLGPAAGPAEDVEGGSITEFEKGALALTPAGRVFVIQGEILTAYLDSGGPAGDLGFPTADEASTDGGWISTFEGGVITYLDGVAEVTVN